MLDCKRDLKVQRERMSELEAAAAVRTGGGEGGAAAAAAAAASRTADLKAVVEHGEELLQWHPDWERLARTRSNPYRDEIDIFIPPLVRAGAADGKAPAHPHTRTPARTHPYVGCHGHPIGIVSPAEMICGHSLCVRAVCPVVAAAAAAIITVR
jgi:hypothetical protein